MQAKTLKPLSLSLIVSSIMFLTACSGGGGDKAVLIEGDKKTETNKLLCEPHQIIENNKCIDVGKINSIKPFIVKNKKTVFTITGQKLSKKLVVQFDKCANGKLISQSDNIIKYECTPEIGTHNLTLKVNNQPVYAEKILVKKETSNSKIDLPKMPKTPNATLKGVDDNNNGVRDEVEIEIASYITDNQSYQQALVSAKAYQKILEKSSPVDRKQALSMMSDLSCQLSNGLLLSNNNDIYLLLTFNNSDRQKKYNTFISALDGGFDGSELVNCQ